jgi:Outer membrane protein beta-barrel domain
MKRIYFLGLFCALAVTGFAQQDSTKTKTSKNDTIRIGSIIIIKKHRGNKRDSVPELADYSGAKKNKKVSTNYFVLDLGFAGWNDATNYANTGSSIINTAGTPAFSAADMKLRGGKSANVNLWLFMQKIALVKNNVNLKYGLGVEWHNYSLRNPVSFKEGGPSPLSPSLSVPAPFIFRDSISLSKNKLNLKYITVPLMLNFASNKGKGKPSLSASFGVSASYLIRQRNKQNSSERGKQKNQGDYDLEKFKLSYIAELGLGQVRLYGSYTPKSIFERGLDIRPFAVGIRFSNW